MIKKGGESNIYYEVNERESLLQRSRSPDYETGFERMVRPLLAECFGTAAFVAVATMAAITSSQSPLVVAAVHGFLIFVLVSVFSDVSGGHFNPAVTFGVLLSGEIKFKLAVGYVIAQLLGAVLGSACCMMILSYDPIDYRHESLFTLGGGGMTEVAVGVADRQAISCEALLTCLLVLTVLMCAVDQCNGAAPLCIGMLVFVDILAGGKISGASMNPARSFGPAVVMALKGNGQWSRHYVYWAGPGIGAVIAAAFFKLGPTSTNTATTSATANSYLLSHAHIKVGVAYFELGPTSTNTASGALTTSAHLS